eukprot:TRINITY_DN2962_c0_g1_i1.p1 TRINITY_DN2962_c0_g1~~TRINITY_DN2962_c0_g1_i1.p1  ORF type:complete len:1635 (-),score=447.93 TRINITY_DN2962_c0_g1_i1:72-4520(-)
MDSWLLPKKKSQNSENSENDTDDNIFDLNYLRSNLVGCVDQPKLLENNDRKVALKLLEVILKAVLHIENGVEIINEYLLTLNNLINNSESLSQWNLNPLNDIRYLQDVVKGNEELELSYEKEGKFYVFKNPKGFKGKSGLYNLGNTCYFNCIIQLLYSIDEFRNFILQLTFSDEFLNKLANIHNSNETITYQIAARILQLYEFKSLFVHMLFGLDKAADTSKLIYLCRSFSGEPLSVYEQQDLNEVLLNLLNDLDDGLKYYNQYADNNNEQSEKDEKDEKDPSVIEKLFGSKLLSCFQGIEDNCSHINYSKQNSLIHMIPIAEGDTDHTLGECFEEYVNGDYLVGDSQYNCSKCKQKRDTHMSSWVDKESLGKYQFMMLKRSYYDFMTDTKIKNSAKVLFDTEIDLSSICKTESQLQDAETSKQRLKDISSTSIPFNLHGLAVHSGNALSGHYWSYVINNFSDKIETSDFIQFNDSSVQIVNGSGVSQQSYGMAQEDIQTIKEIEQRFQTGSLSEAEQQRYIKLSSQACAYLLCYRLKEEDETSIADLVEFKIEESIVRRLLYENSVQINRVSIINEPFITTMLNTMLYLVSRLKDQINAPSQYFIMLWEFYIKVVCRLTKFNNYTPLTNCLLMLWKAMEDNREEQLVIINYFSDTTYGEEDDCCYFQKRFIEPLLISPNDEDMVFVNQIMTHIFQSPYMEINLVYKFYMQFTRYLVVGFVHKYKLPYICNMISLLLQHLRGVGFENLNIYVTFEKVIQAYLGNIVGINSSVLFENKFIAEKEWNSIEDLVNRCLFDTVSITKNQYEKNEVKREFDNRYIIELCELLLSFCKNEVYSMDGEKIMNYDGENYCYELYRNIDYVIPIFLINLNKDISNVLVLYGKDTGAEEYKKVKEKYFSFIINMFNEDIRVVDFLDGTQTEEELRLFTEIMESIKFDENSETLTVISDILSSKIPHLYVTEEKVVLKWCLKCLKNYENIPKLFFNDVFSTLIQRIIESTNNEIMINQHQLTTLYDSQIEMFFTNTIELCEVVNQISMFREYVSVLNQNLIVLLNEISQKLPHQITRSRNNYIANNSMNTNAMTAQYYQRQELALRLNKFNNVIQLTVFLIKDPKFDFTILQGLLTIFDEIEVSEVNKDVIQGLTKLIDGLCHYLNSNLTLPQNIVKKTNSTIFNCCNTITFKFAGENKRITSAISANALLSQFLHDYALPCLALAEAISKYQPIVKIFLKEEAGRNFIIKLFSFLPNRFSDYSTKYYDNPKIVQFFIEISTNFAKANIDHVVIIKELLPHIFKKWLPDKNNEMGILRSLVFGYSFISNLSPEKKVEWIKMVKEEEFFIKTFHVAMENGLNCEIFYQFLVICIQTNQFDDVSIQNIVENILETKLTLSKYSHSNDIKPDVFEEFFNRLIQIPHVQTNMLVSLQKQLLDHKYEYMYSKWLNETICCIETMIESKKIAPEFDFEDNVDKMEKIESDENSDQNVNQ